jgi:hypothetical protein
MMKISGVILLSFFTIEVVSGIKVKGNFPFCGKKTGEDRSNCPIIKEIDVVESFDKCTKDPFVIFSDLAGDILNGFLKTDGSEELYQEAVESNSCSKEKVVNKFSDFTITRILNNAFVKFEEKNKIDVYTYFFKFFQKKYPILSIFVFLLIGLISGLICLKFRQKFSIKNLKTFLENFVSKKTDDDLEKSIYHTPGILNSNKKINASIFNESEVNKEHRVKFSDRNLNSVKKKLDLSPVTPSAPVIDLTYYIDTSRRLINEKKSSLHESPRLDSTRLIVEEERICQDASRKDIEIQKEEEYKRQQENLRKVEEEKLRIERREAAIQREADERLRVEQQKRAAEIQKEEDYKRLQERLRILEEEKLREERLRREAAEIQREASEKLRIEQQKRAAEIQREVDERLRIEQQKRAAEIQREVDERLRIEQQKRAAEIQREEDYRRHQATLRIVEEEKLREERLRREAAEIQREASEKLRIEQQKRVAEIQREVDERLRIEQQKRAAEIQREEDSIRHQGTLRQVEEESSQMEHPNYEVLRRFEDRGRSYISEINSPIRGGENTLNILFKSPSRSPPFSPIYLNGAESPCPLAHCKSSKKFKGLLGVKGHMRLAHPDYVETKKGNIIGYVSKFFRL